MFIKPKIKETLSQYRLYDEFIRERTMAIAELGKIKILDSVEEYEILLENEKYRDAVNISHLNIPTDDLLYGWKCNFKDREVLLDQDFIQVKTSRYECGEDTYQYNIFPLSCYESENWEQLSIVFGEKWRKDRAAFIVKIRDNHLAEQKIIKKQEQSKKEKEERALYNKLKKKFG